MARSAFRLAAPRVLAAAPLALAYRCGPSERTAKCELIPRASVPAEVFSPLGFVPGLCSAAAQARQGNLPLPASVCVTAEEYTVLRRTLAGSAALEVRTNLCRVGRSEIEVEHRVYGDSAVIGEVKSVLAHVGEDNRQKPWPDIDALKALQSKRVLGKMANLQADAETVDWESADCVTVDASRAAGSPEGLAALYTTALADWCELNGYDWTPKKWTVFGPLKEDGSLTLRILVRFRAEPVAEFRLEDGDFTVSYARASGRVA